MRMKHALVPASVTLASLAAPGCALFSPSPVSEVCDVEVQRTSAWINAMPTIGKASRQLIVMMIVDDDGISRRLDLQETSSDGRASFNLVEWGPEEGLGKAVYRGSETSAQAVDIYCDGRLVSAVERITVAH